MSDDTSNSYSIIDMFQIKPDKKSNIITYNSIDTTDNISEITSKDLKYARDNVINTIEIGQAAMSEMLNLASQSQQASNYDVLTKLMATVLKANHDLVDLHTKNQQLTGAKEDDKKEGKTVNQTLFVGSTDEMLKLAEKMKKPT